MTPNKLAVLHLSKMRFLGGFCAILKVGCGVKISRVEDWRTANKRSSTWFLGISGLELEDPRSSMFIKKKSRLRRAFLACSKNKSPAAGFLAY